jgi:DNA-binding XRE family transcriptional regulator
MSNVKLYNRVALLREARGLSRKELAEHLGINYQTVGYLERGEYNPSLELALKMSQFFGLPVELIFSLTPFPPLEATLRAQSNPNVQVSND